MLSVLKFGGSSVSDAEGIRRAARIIEEKSRSGQTVTVLSARGGATDALIAAARELCAEPDKRELDALMATGELCSTALMAMYLKSRGTDSISLSGAQAGIKTEGEFGNADIADIDTARIRRELGMGRAVIAAGFQGVSAEGELQTIGRGGSDTTAVYLASRLGAEECLIYTDVDGIYTADPRIVSGACRLSEIDKRDMLLLSLGGSQVLHSKSVLACIRENVELRLLSSFTSGEGTLVTDTELPLPISGITRDRKTGELSVVGYMANAALLENLSELLSASGLAVHEKKLGEGIIKLRTDAECSDRALRLVHSFLL